MDTLGRVDALKFAENWAVCIAGVWRLSAGWPLGFFAEIAMEFWHLSARFWGR
jgi:hypothetical protein